MEFSETRVKLDKIGEPYHFILAFDAPYTTKGQYPKEIWGVTHVVDPGGKNEVKKDGMHIQLTESLKAKIEELGAGKDTGLIIYKKKQQDDPSRTYFEVALDAGSGNLPPRSSNNDSTSAESNGAASNISIAEDGTIDTALAGCIEIIKKIDELTDELKSLIGKINDENEFNNDDLPF